MVFRLSIIRRGTVIFLFSRLFRRRFCFSVSLEAAIPITAFNFINIDAIMLFAAEKTTAFFVFVVTTFSV